MSDHFKTGLIVKLPILFERQKRKPGKLGWVPLGSSDIVTAAIPNVFKRFGGGWVVLGIIAICFVGCESRKPPVAKAQLKPNAQEADLPAEASQPRPQPDPPNETEPREVIDRTVPIVDENGVTFLPAQLSKNSTLLVLAFEPDIRADYIVMTARTILTPEQMLRAKKLALDYDDQFRVLSRRRSGILEKASDDKDIDRQILKIEMELAMLMRQIRTRINLEIMTQEQRVEAVRIFNEKMAEKEQREETDQSTDHQPVENDPADKSPSDNDLNGPSVQN